MSSSGELTTERIRRPRSPMTLKDLAHDDDNDYLVIILFLFFVVVFFFLLVFQALFLFWTCQSSSSASSARVDTPATSISYNGITFFL